MPAGYVDFGIENNQKDPKFKVGDHVKILKYKIIFAKGYVSNRSEEVFVIKKVKNTVQWTYVFIDLNGEEIVETLYDKKLQNIAKIKKSRVEKVIKRKGDKLYVTWKGYNN